MEFANRRYFIQACQWAVNCLLLLAIISCAQLDKTAEDKVSRPSKDTIKFESRDSLLWWHDETYKSYYGLKGPVEHVVIHPVRASSGELTNDGWELWFNKQGRLMRKQRFSATPEPEFETIYLYNKEDQTLSRIMSQIEKKLWRSSDYIYKNGQLVRVEYRDNTNNEHFRVKRSKQNTRHGWFDIQMPVEKIEMPRYSEFRKSGELVWSNKGDINNGLGEMFFIRTVDGVTSSSVVNQNTEQMSGRGGYRYRYYDSGLLKVVESYNAHNNRLFHVTNYKYDDLQLLVEESREVKDSSVFDQVIPEKVKYQYLSIDSHGNWLKRVLRYSTKYQQQFYNEKRDISYFSGPRP